MLGRRDQGVVELERRKALQRNEPNVSLAPARSKERADYLATNSPEVDFALVLSRVIDNVKANPAELRNAIYELARVKLHREGWQSKTELWEMRRLTMALETAIERVEALSSKHDEIRALQSLERLIGDFNGPAAASSSLPAHSVIAIDQIPHPHVKPGQSSLMGRATTWVQNVRYVMWKAQQAGPVSLRHSAAAGARIGLLLLVAVTLYVTLSRFEIFTSRAPSSDHSQQIAKNDQRELPAELPTETVQSPSAALPLPIPTATPPAEQADLERTRGFPLPAVYGIYAINEGKLYELNALPGRAPDPRIFMSAVIKTPSQAIIANGRVSFLAYRRDLATSAPDRVGVRVIAKVKRSLAIDATGKAQVNAVDDTWAIRNTSYEFRVSPVPDSTEMILLRPEDPDFVLPAGRYAMVLNGLSYDFTVAGDVTETAQCLERTVAANGTFYSECRKP